MKILILTVGTRGDVQPYVAVGKTLVERGHEVMICAPETFATFITDHGLQYGPMPNDILDLLDTQAGRDAMENTNGVLGAARTTLKLIKRVKPIQQGIMQACYDAARDFAPEALLCHVKTLCGVHLAEKFNIPVVLTLPLPAMVPTAEFPALGMPALTLPGPLQSSYHRFSYQLVKLGLAAYRGLIQKFRTDVLQLPAQPGDVDFLHHTDGRAVPFLHLYSSHVGPVASDWPESTAVTGYAFLASPPWEMPEDLRAFLAHPEAPVYIGFGSIGGKDPAATAKTVLEAVRRAKVRAVLATGWGGLKPEQVPENVFVIEHAPHEHLFPHMAAVVHHGGAGSTAAGLRAGKPTLICPFFGDQPFWGERVRQLKVGPAPIPQKQLTAAKLAHALRLICYNETFQHNARQLATQLQEEQGNQRAADFLETHFALAAHRA